MQKLILLNTAEKCSNAWLFIYIPELIMSVAHSQQLSNILFIVMSNLIQ